MSIEDLKLILAGELFRGVMLMVQVIATASIGVFLYFLGVNNSNKKSRVDLTLELWSQWSLPDFHQARIDVGDHFVLEDGSDSRYAAVSIVALRNSLTDPNAYKKYGMMIHFFMEVADLKRHKYLDNRLFGILFRSTLRRWRDRFHSVTADGESDDERIHNLDVVRSALDELIRP